MVIKPFSARFADGGGSAHSKMNADASKTMSTQLTLREYLIGQAVVGLASSRSPEEVATKAIDIADAVMASLEEAELRTTRTYQGGEERRVKTSNRRRG
jgi:hypothetical protein